MSVSMFLVLVTLQSAAAAAGNPCAPGVVAADDCLGIGAVGCCSPDGGVRWCKNGILCEQSCATAPACGWKSSTGKYGCAAKPKADPDCEHPYACFVDGCAPMWEQEGCCGCPCEDCVCGKDPYCCTEAWDPVCVEECRACGGCGSKDGCAPSLNPGCNGCEYELCTCQVDPYCCVGNWDSLCVQICSQQCGAECQPCVPDCTLDNGKEKECGDDGCGGKCGICAPNAKCEDGECKIPCFPKCAGKECGPDGCGKTCGTCKGQDQCTPLGKCVYVCKPDCTNKQCGDDGCGQACGKCPEDEACLDGQCVAGVCVPQCAGKQCGSDGCGWLCGFCPPETICDPTGKCITYCKPQCDGKLCGDDGCGGLCGQCAPGLNCVDGECEAVCYPYCQGKQCGSDYCGGLCGTCGAGTVCQDPPGLCVPPAQCMASCIGKECGSDGCGGTCGTCPMNWYCSMAMCVPSCQPQCLVPPDFMFSKQCGWDECPGAQGVCGVCPAGYYCGPGYLCMEDKCSCDGVQCGPPDVTCPSCGDCPEGLTCDMELLIDPATNVCESCQPNCLKDNGMPKECGSDGCGGKCGSDCPAGFSCDEDPNDGDGILFNCEPCVAKCVNQDGSIKQCGSDGCVGNCGSCPIGTMCDETVGQCKACIGQCMVPPAFAIPMACGPNNCPTGCLDQPLGPCGKAGECPVDQVCNAFTKQCVACGTCGKCSANWRCDIWTEDDDDLYVCEPCTPSCAGKECGDNGCGGTCGLCPLGFTCSPDYKCVKPCDPTAGCFGKQCGPNGCDYGCMEDNSGADCGPLKPPCPDGTICDPGETGNAHWKCVGCTGGCGMCPVGEYCAEGYKCKTAPDPCKGKECGPDGIGGDCGACAEGLECKNSKCVAPDTDVVVPDIVEEVEDEDITEPETSVTPDVPAEDEGITPKPDVQQPHVCPPCQKWYFVQCVDDPTQPGCGDDGGGGGGGCTCATGRPAAVPLWPAVLLLGGLLLSMRVARRKGQ